MTQRKKTENQHFRPDEAVEYISAHAGNRYQARLMIADALHSGDLICYAEKVWEASDIDPTHPWETITSDAKLIGEDVEVSSSTWKSSFCWPDETRYWDWRSGNLLINVSEDPIEFFYALLLQNVQFDRKSVMALIGRTERTGAGGPKPDKVKWANFWINFLADCTGDHFDWTQFETKRQLKQAMLGSSPDLFSDSNVDFAVDLAWERLVLQQSRERAVARSLAAS